MADILTCWSRKSTGGIYNISDVCIPFKVSRRVTLPAEPSVMLLVTPVVVLN